MVSERSYWIILISSLTIFMVVDMLWVYPVIMRDLPGFGKDLFTNVLFTVFTIVFLTWGINIREERTWRIVGKKVEERIEYRLQKILGDISAYFLKPVPQLKDEKVRQSKKGNRTADRVGREKAAAVCLAEYYANQESLELGEFVKAFLKKPEKNVATYLIENFRRESDFLEHIVSEYPDFLPPDFMYAIMEIEDDLNDVVDVLWIVSMLESSQSKDSEMQLQSAIHKIIKEICQLNEKELVFADVDRKR